MIAICIHSALLLLLFLLIFLLFLRKPLQSQRRFEKVLLSILIVLFSLLGARHTPNLENLVLRYASPESAFQYLGRGDYIGSISGENEVVAISSGNSNSVLRLSVSGDRYRADALPVQTSSATFENYERGSIVSVTLIPSQKAGAYYVVIRLFSKTPVAVSDAYGSDFSVFPCQVAIHSILYRISSLLAGAVSIYRRRIALSHQPPQEQLREIPGVLHASSYQIPTIIGGTAYGKTNLRCHHA